MTATALHAPEAAPSADRSAWAVPGVGQDEPGAHGPLAGGSGGGSGSGSHPIVTAVVTCLEALESVRGVSATTLSAKEIRLMLLAVMQIAAAAFALKLRLIVAGEVQRVADLTGARSTAAFVAHLTQTAHAHASAEVRLAKDLDERYRSIAEALESGLMTADHVRVAVSALRRLPKDLDADQLEACQQFLIDAAQRVSPHQLRRLGRRLWEIVDPEAADRKLGEELEEEEELARAKAMFKSWRNGDGTTSFKGRLPDLQATMLVKAVQAFASPRRRANPHIHTGQPDDVRDASVATADCPSAGTGETEDAGRSRDLGNDGIADPDDLGDSPEEQQTGRPVPYPVRLGHGLMELLERLPGDILPSTHGSSALVRVTVDFDELRRRIGAACIDADTEASPAQTRRLACSANILPVVLGGQSQPLDVGRERRLHTKAQREGMDVRDGGCVADGCTVTAEWCHAHHAEAWEDGGETSVEKGFLVCSYHHHLVHSSRWSTWWTDGALHFRRHSRSRVPA